jgi:myo-inositol-1(or 4)-monophosphatase
MGIGCPRFHFSLMEFSMLPDIAFFDVIAEAAAAETLPRFRMPVTIDNKQASGFDPVTEADRAAEKAIRQLISERYPEHGILGEEHGDVGLDRDYVWVIDPIDGTRAFISGLPVWGTLVGLYHKGKAVMGMMDQPFTGERFIARPGEAAVKRNGVSSPLSTRKNVSLDQAIMMTTSPMIFPEALEPSYKRVEASVQLARYGCDCYAYAMVASGHIDLVVESDLKPYDVGGLIPLVEQAGGVMTTWSGGRPEMGGTIVASGSAALHETVLELLNRN